jgi:hypothetical protein
MVSILTNKLKKLLELYNNSLKLYNNSLKLYNSFTATNSQFCNEINNNLKLNSYAEFKRN